MANRNVQVPEPPRFSTNVEDMLARVLAAEARVAEMQRALQFAFGAGHTHGWLSGYAARAEETKEGSDG